MIAFRAGSRNPRTFRWLRLGWGNEGWSADTTYLEAVCRWASRVQGPILECGSGLTTILLGIVAPGRVTTLEHMPEWKEHVQQAATKQSAAVNILAAPLSDYGGFQWYTLPGSLTGNHELVVCDGPPGMTVGGRYGLFPIARDLLSRNAVILLDDVERIDEQLLIKRWKREFGIQCEESHTQNGTYAELRVGKWVKSDSGWERKERAKYVT
jgi:Methyltransferase domain